MTKKTTITWGDASVTGRIAGYGDVGILLAHGAGTNQEHPFMTALRDSLAAAGHLVMTFNYPYTERGSKRPDRTERLIEAHRAAGEYLAPKVDTLVLAGRSMGGRMATYLVADGFPATGVILYAYPLHPAGRPDRLRVDHFPRVTVPLLFLQGTRDALSKMELFDRHIRSLPNATIELLEGADHSFRGGGWDRESIIQRLTEVSTGWIDGLRSGRTKRSRP